MKAIMISIKPKWCAKIMDSEKTIEVRKNKALANAIQKLIDEYGFAEIYVYCSKDGYNHLHEFYDHSTDETLGYSTCYYESNNIKGWDIEPAPLNGKVIFKFRCYNVEELYIRWGWGWETKSIDDIKVLESKTCLTRYDFAKYLKGRRGCAIHISNLEIFDEPKELSEFIKCDNSHIRIGNCFIGFGGIPRLTKAPQNFCYVEVKYYE